jgi:geranylgeranyl reductase family protein
MQCDVAIVGAGPAGATAARSLAKNGLKVILVEKDDIPKEKPCGGMVTPRVFERFKYLRSEMEKLAVSSSYGACLYPPSLATKVQYVTTKPQILMILRKKFDHTLVRMAMDSGAMLINNRVKGLVIRPDIVRMLLDGNTIIESSIVVGADGVNSVIAKETDLLPILNSEKVALAVVSESKIGESAVEECFGDRRTVHLFFGFNNLFGYAWVFPKMRHVNIGLGGLLSRTRDIKGSFMKFIQVLRKNGLIPKRLQIESYSAALIPLGGPIERTYRDRVVLCGDAAGFVNPLTGEGVYYAMASGEIASKVIMDAIESGKLSGQKLSEYETAWMDDFGKGLKMAASFQKKLMGATRILEFVVKLAKADKNLTEMLANICLRRKPINKTSTEKLLLRLPISTGKYFYKKLFESRDL